MSKFKRKIKLEFGREVKHFYKTFGSWGMYYAQRRGYAFGIPFIIGLVCTVEWGYDLY